MEKKQLATILLGATLLGSAGARGDDTDLFTITSTSDVPRPNVLIVLDNTANWNNAFDFEVSTLQSVITGLNENYRVGLMLFTETGGTNKGPDGGYIRADIHRMNDTYKPALLSTIAGLNKTSDKGNNEKVGLMMYEVYEYFKGAASYAGGPAGDPTNGKAKSDSNAFVSGTATYDSPISNSCQKNFVIFISNGKGSDNTADTTTATTFLSNAGGNTTQLTISPNTFQSNIGDEWARFMSGNDISSQDGTQTITTYTVDVQAPGDATGQHPAGWSAFLNSMATNGGGKYFTATDAASLTAALNKAFAEVQAVNSVYSSSTLPVSINVRGTYLNQVYMGVFRPDPGKAPRWVGNLKQYKLAVDKSTYPPTLFLADQNGYQVENASTGFTSPNAVSYWTTGSTYWSFSGHFGSYHGSSDSPDGDLVEKGGAAQVLRTTYPAPDSTTAQTRNLITCPVTAGCTANAAIATTFDTTNITAANLGVATNAERDSVVNWMRGLDNIDDENQNSSFTDIRAYVHGDVLHSRPAVINYNRNTASCASTTPNNNDVMVYYGTNDGILHAVKGGQDSTGGQEQWGFILPEFIPPSSSTYGRVNSGLAYSDLKRLRDGWAGSAVLISDTNPKPYFVDGTIGAWTKDNDGDCKLNTTTGTNKDTAWIFPSMRRGGRFIYALNVVDPASPVFKWKISNATTGFSELGYTWSEPKAVKMKINGVEKVVLIFGGGYDPDVEDFDPDRTTTVSGTTTHKQITADHSADATTATSGPYVTQTVTTTPSGGTATTNTVTKNRTMGRAIYVVDADTGTLIWRAERSGTAAADLYPVTGLDYAIPSDLTLLDRNGDGYIDRAYAVDTGGNVWRLNIGDQADTSNWTVTKLATLGGITNAKRKFLYPPDVVYASPTIEYDAVMVGSGDREHPFDTSVQNRFYMLKDSQVGVSSIAESELFDATSNCLQTNSCTADQLAAFSTGKGWYINLDNGEKVVGAPITLGGAVYFGTNMPAPLQAGQCSNLGVARLYQLDYKNGKAIPDINANTSGNRYRTRQGGGYPPSPVPLVVEIDGKQYEGVVSGTQVQTPPSVLLGKRYRSYWYMDTDK